MHTLKRLGFSPVNVLDVGCHKGFWTQKTRTIFPNASYYMVDAEYYTEADNLGLPYVVTALAEAEKMVDWYSIRGTGDSMYRELTTHYAGVEPKKRNAQPLDALFKNTPFDFLKVDCQGAEIPILKGARKTLESVEAILIEMPFAGIFNDAVPNFREHINFMDEIGYVPLDIEEFHRPHDVPIQIDIIFVRKDSKMLAALQSLIRAF